MAGRTTTGNPCATRSWCATRQHPASGTRGCVWATRRSSTTGRRSKRLASPPSGAAAADPMRGRGAELVTVWTGSPADRGTFRESGRTPPTRVVQPSAELPALQQLRDQRRDRGALRPGERDVPAQVVPLERLDHARDAVVPPDPQVVALPHVVRED